MYLQHIQYSHFGHACTECARWRSVQTRGDEQTAIRRSIDSNLNIFKSHEIVEVHSYTFPGAAHFSRVRYCLSSSPIQSKDQKEMT